MPDAIGKLLTCGQVQDRIGLGTSTIYRLMRRGTFPSPLKIGGKCVRWDADEIEAWLASRPRATGVAA